MKNIMTWLTVGGIATGWVTAGVIAASGATGCSVTVTDSDAGATGGSGGTGATGGSGGASGGVTGGTAGTAGTGGTAGSAGTAGTGGTAGSDGGSGPMCIKMQTDPNCTKCGFDKCQQDHCACNANAACRGAMTAFYTCMAMPGANSIGCAQTFATNANSDTGSATLANDLATCVIDDCEDTCQGRDASTLRRDRAEILRSIRGQSNQ